MDERIRILLVDDERLVRRSMEKTLLRAGYDVETAGDVRTALETFEAGQASTPFDLAILDIRMPNMEGNADANAGLTLLEELLTRDRDLPVLMLTAFDEVGRAKKAVRRGARAYFVKGREAELLQLIEETLEENEVIHD
jgi:DNA-binding NtrC family response regulator